MGAVRLILLSEHVINLETEVLERILVFHMFIIRYFTRFLYRYCSTASRRANGGRPN